MKPLLKKRLSVVLCILTVFCIIYSCKKELTDNQSVVVVDPAVLKAKSWYESTYPNAGNKNTGANNVNNAGNVDFSKLIKPDWNNAKTYSRFNEDVVEMPYDPSSNLGMEMRNTSTGTIMQAKNSLSSFLFIKGAAGYKAYIMTLVADSAYLKGDFNKLRLNHYNKRDTLFSGLALYFTVDGEFMNGWKYKNGKVVNKLSSNQPVGGGSTKQVQTVKQTNGMICVDWYYTTSTNGVTYGPFYGGTICSAYDDYLAGDGGSAGGDSGTPPANGPVPGDGGGSNGDANNSPCIPKPNSVNSLKNKVNDLPSEGVDPGDGFPNPTDPGTPVNNDPCAENTQIDPIKPTYVDEGLQPLCVSSIVLKKSSGNTSEVNLSNVKFGIKDDDRSMLIVFNLYINIPNAIKDPSNPTKTVIINEDMQKKFIYEAYHFASLQIDLTHGEDFFYPGSQPKYSKQYAQLVQFYLNNIALEGMFPAYQNANPGLVPSLGSTTSTLINPSKSSSARYTDSTSGLGC